MNLLTLILFMTQMSLGYIPSADFIIKKTVKNHGIGLYLISQEVVLQRREESLSVQEEWLIKDGRTMRLKVKTPKISILYKNNQKSWFENGKVQRRSLPSKFLEPFFHIRRSKPFYELLFFHRIVSPDIYKYRPQVHSLKDIKYPSNPYLKLKMIDDQIIFQFMNPYKNNPQRPLIWISQDNFDLLKIRLSSETEISAQDYQGFSGNLRFPRVRTYSWKNAKATARILSIDKVSRKKRATLNTDSIKQNPTLPVTNTLLKEFYSQFR